MSFSQFRRQFTVAVVMVTTIALLAPPSWTAQSAVLGGRVLATDGLTPRAGAIVHLVDGANRIWPSKATRPDGGFLIDDAPAGNYTLVVETSEGAFVAPERVSLQAGANPPLALAINADRRDEGFGSEAGEGLPKWLAWAIGGTVFVGALFLIDELSEDDDDDDDELLASPF